MILSKYIKGLQEFVKDHPEAKDFKVITSKDDEGNGFNEVYFSPSLGEFDGEDFMQDYEGEDPVELNAVCVN